MLMSIPSYKVWFCSKGHEIELVVSGSDNVENIVRTLFFNGISKINIDDANDFDNNDRVYRLKVSEI